MKLLKSIPLLLLSFSLLFTVGCFEEVKEAINKTSTKKKAIDFGSYKNGVYTNSFFDLKVTLPKDWSVMGDEARIALMKQGSKIVAGDDKNLKAVMKASDLQSVNLLTCSEKPLGAAIDFNSSIMILAESVKHMPGIKRGSDYHFHSKKLLKQSAMSVSFPRDIYEEKISDKSFDVMDMEMFAAGQTIQQKQYIRIMNGYAFVIIMTYKDDSGFKKLKKILNKIEL